MLTTPDHWHCDGHPGFRIHRDPNAACPETFAHAAARTLQEVPKRLESHYLYDAAGSALFDAITKQPEYYLTRVEASILHAHADSIRAATGPTALVELGSGSSEKTEHLLAAWCAAGGSTYVPIDVSQAALEAAARKLHARFPALSIEAVAATYGRALPQLRDLGPITLVFLGSSIGNFADAELDGFLAQVRRHLRPGDFFLLGIDLIKDRRILEAAYNDAAGVTARFTKNLFVRMNRELGTRIDIDHIEHVAHYAADRQQIEISARFRQAHTLHCDALPQPVDIAAGEAIRTEVSRKFEVATMAAHCAAAHLPLRHVYQDRDQSMALMLCQAA